MEANIELQESGAWTDAVGPTILTLAVHGVALLGLAAILVLGVPRYAKVFAEMRMALPAVTQLVLNMSRFTRSYLLLLAPPLLLADGVVYFALRAQGQTKALSRAWSAAVMIVLLLCAALTIVGLQVPLHTLMTDIGSS